MKCPTCGHDLDYYKRRRTTQPFALPRPTVDERIEKAIVRPVTLKVGMTVREAAEAMQVVPRDLAQWLMKQGIFATMAMSVTEWVVRELTDRFKLTETTHVK